MTAPEVTADDVLAVVSDLLHEGPVATWSNFRTWWPGWRAVSACIRWPSTWRIFVRTCCVS